MASTSGSTPDEVFDASKHAKAPPRFYISAPQDAPAVRVGLVSPTIGYGLFAARDFAKDEFIFHEAPMMTALFNEKFAADQTLVQSQVAAYRAALASHPATAVAFPVPAARFGIAPPAFDRAAAVLASGELGRNLAHGRFAGSTVTRDQYDAYVAGIKAVEKPSEADARDACLDFFKHYAFEVGGRGAGSGVAAAAAAASSFSASASSSSSSSSCPASSASVTREACIYLLGSLINHCCTVPASSSGFLGSSGKRSSSSSLSGTEQGPNCCWRIGPSGLAHFVKPRHICVQARRAIREGEQLTWDYGKREKGFVCECDTCRGSFVGGLGQICAIL
ncbi:uncharacterized protein THITE_56443 [Thermothielavioides terrestris NRRL 8126]|uniref:SET domain-containing protein n=1 Tax=Thermothielavioides terrestris (strain ATCC 38088 / NRRL 8126) TaxID=578455 RepID=G2QY79_THETT|nr:uncharacterized protein THITE_56443 [Thermothielavioides terrestris NRRL 8126]AEO65373.1 hypothetical protein THITE_56443 [Thermothielavioides terrestris NRRL 8126]